MSRGIRFRAMTIDEVENSMVYGHYSSTPEPRIIYLDLADEEKSALVDVETLGQYTGLKDINGTEIYEGDIATSRTITNGFQCSGTVEFESAQFIFRVKETQFGRSGWSQALANKVIEYTVVGSVHEHPHLLEVPNE